MIHWWREGCSHWSGDEKNISVCFENISGKVILKNREKNRNVKGHFYVIEETHIDGIVIWQSKSGKVFKTEYKKILK